MPVNDQVLSGLKEAVRLSPNNFPLRQALAETLLSFGRHGEAEAEYRTALGLAPDNEKLKIGLATAFYGQGKYSEALVVVEESLKKDGPSAAALILYSRLLLATGDREKAAAEYERAVELDGK